MTLSALSRRALAPGAAAALTLTALPALADTTLLNVSYDPTRKLYQAFNTAFAKQWKAKSGVEVFTPNPKTSGGARGCSRPTPPASRCGAATTCAAMRIGFSKSARRR